MATPLDTLNFPGDFVLDYAFIVNHKGETVDITSSITELNVYENIDRPFITGEFAFADSNGIVKDNDKYITETIVTYDKDFLEIIKKEVSFT